MSIADEVRPNKRVKFVRVLRQSSLFVFAIYLVRKHFLSLQLHTRSCHVS